MPKPTIFSASDRSADARLNAPRLVVFALLGLGLCWLVISFSVASSLSTTAPETALFLSANEPNSLLARADNELNSNGGEEAKTSKAPRPTPKRLQLMREQVETALLLDPLPSLAYRLLGQIAEKEGSAAKAEKFMREAARHSLNENFAVHWMMLKSFERKNYPAAAFYADALLRSTSGISAVAPVLAHMAEDQSATQEVKKLLSANPSWRPGFFSALGSYITDARTPLNLFMSLRDTAAPPTEEELNSYQWFLFQHKFYPLAYYAWLQFLPPEKLEGAGLLFNGDFEATPSGSPFDWQTPAGANVIMDFAPRPDNAMDHALVIEFGPGRVEFPGVTQSLLLLPGAYSLKGSLMGEIAGAGRRGLQWGISCLDGATIAQSQMILGSFPDWRAFELSFVVPETGCPAQSLQLKLAARSPSEKLVSGEIWFDSLSISRDEKKVQDKAQNDQAAAPSQPPGARPRQR